MLYAISVDGRGIVVSTFDPINQDAKCADAEFSKKERMNEEE